MFVDGIIISDAIRYNKTLRVTGYSVNSNFNVFCFAQNFLFFLSRIFFPEFNIRWYNKNSESDYYFFQQHWESEYFFRKKTIHPPFKLNGRSLIDLSPSLYKGHSFRIGLCTWYIKQGKTDSQIRSMGRWRSNAFLKYIRPEISGWLNKTYTMINGKMYYVNS